ncbi:hypothetical protein KY363_05930 [Candidatus Woesearchaeota archaeon]|nr:hypothetical protein [Candidatus Woesearchaeota archaeon]
MLLAKGTHYEHYSGEYGGHRKRRILDSTAQKQKLEGLSRGAAQTCQRMTRLTTDYIRILDQYLTANGLSGILVIHASVEQFSPTMPSARYLRLNGLYPANEAIGEEIRKGAYIDSRLDNKLNDLVERYGIMYENFTRSIRPMQKLEQRLTEAA